MTPTPPPQSQFYDHTRGATLEQIRGILQEYLAIVALLAPRLAVRAQLARGSSSPITLPALLLSRLLARGWRSKCGSAARGIR